MRHIDARALVRLLTRQRRQRAGGGDDMREREIDVEQGWRSAERRARGGHDGLAILPVTVPTRRLNWPGWRCAAVARSRPARAQADESRTGSRRAAPRYPSPRRHRQRPVDSLRESRPAWAGPAVASVVADDPLHVDH